MSLSVLFFLTRLPELSPEQFKEHMETVYIPLLKRIMGCHFPPETRVQYVLRVSSGVGDRLGATTASKYRNPPDAPVVLVGSPSDLGWDAMCELTFQDELQLQQGLAVINSDEGQAVKEEEERFSQPDQMKVVIMDSSVLKIKTTAAIDC